MESCLNLFTWREDHDDSSREKNTLFTINILQCKHTNIFLNDYDLWFIEEYLHWHWLNIVCKYCKKITPKVGNIIITSFQKQMLDTGSLDKHFLLHSSSLFWNFYSTTLPICYFTVPFYHSSSTLPLTTCSYSDSKIQTS